MIKMTSLLFSNFHVVSNDDLQYFSVLFMVLCFNTEQSSYFLILLSLLSNGVKLLIFHNYATYKLTGIRKCLNCGAKSFLLFQSIDTVDTYSVRFWFAFESTFYFRV